MVRQSLIDLSSSQSLEEWKTINDVVMGGISQSQVHWVDPGQAAFKGQVSLENNGGFASMRGPIAPQALLGSRGVYLKHKGDGKAYRMRLRSRQGVDYSADFDSKKDERVTSEFPYAHFAAKFRGKFLAEAPPLALILHEIDHWGLLIAEKQAGPFLLLIEDFGVLVDGIKD